MSRVALAAVLLMAWACGRDEPALLELHGTALGTGWSVKAVDPGLQHSLLAAEIAAVLEQVEAQMSTWREDSELTGFNRARSTAWLPVSPPVARVVAEALAVSELSGGAFDPSVGPLVELWGFGPGGPRATPPAPEEIAATRARVGHGRLRVRQQPPALRKLVPDLELDLSGLAKGFAVDVVADRLTALGAVDHLVEIGGEVRAAGRAADGVPWWVGIERPIAARGGLQTRIALADEGLATSGSYRNFVVHEGRRLGHVLDPRSGAPVTHELASVSVIAESAMRADALATALLVLGLDSGFALAQAERLAVLFIAATPAGFVEHSTPAFDRRRVDRKAGR